MNGPLGLPVTTIACSTAKPFDEATFQPLECKAGFRPAFDDEIEGTVRTLWFCLAKVRMPWAPGANKPSCGLGAHASPCVPDIAPTPCTRCCRCGLKASATC